MFTAHEIMKCKNSKSLSKKGQQMPTVHSRKHVCNKYLDWYTGHLPNSAIWKQAVLGLWCSAGRTATLSSSSNIFKVA